MTTEQFIRDRCRMRWSRSQVASALGMSMPKLKTILELIPDLDWPKPHESAHYIEGQRRSRGQCSDALRRACAAGRAALHDKFPKYTVGEVTGTLREVYDHWAPLVSVTHSQAARRIRSGMGIHDALFKPSQTSKGWGQNGKFWQNVHR